MASLDRCGKSRPHRDSIPGPSSPQAVCIPTELPGPRSLCSSLSLIAHECHQLRAFHKEIQQFWRKGLNNGKHFYVLRKEIIFYPRGVQTPGTRSPWRLNFVRWHLISILQVNSTKPAAYHLPSAQNFEMSPRFLENLCTLILPCLFFIQRRRQCSQ